MSDDAAAAEMLLEAARAVGWAPPEGAASTIEAITKWCLRQCARIDGDLDRAHAENAVHDAILCARHGNLSYTIAGLHLAHESVKRGY